MPALTNNSSSCTVDVCFSVNTKSAQGVVAILSRVTLQPGEVVTRRISKESILGICFAGEGVSYSWPYVKKEGHISYPLPAPGTSISLQPGICPTVLRGLETPYSWSFE
jgi:hypothetical protein